MRTLADRRLSDRVLGSAPPPAAIPGLVVWLDAAAITGLADTDPVTSWENLAETESFTQANAGNQPTYRTGLLNGLPGVRFDGSDDLDGSISRLLKPSTIFAVVTPTNVAGNDVFVGNVSGNNSLNVRFSSNRITLVDEGTANIASSDSDLTNGVPVVVDASYSVTGEYLFGLNGVDDGSGINNRGLNPAVVCIGARDSGNEDFNGDIHEILIYNLVLSSNDRQFVRNYLRIKWGI